MIKKAENFVPHSLCTKCVRPLSECEYLLESRWNRPHFIPGSEYIEAEVYGYKTRKSIVYIITKCPKFTDQIPGKEEKNGSNEH